MKNSSISFFLVAVSALLFLFLAQPAMSGEVVSGEVIETLREESIIIVDPKDVTEDLVLIKGFPYNYAERELEVTLGLGMDTIAIEKGDCITLSYFTAEMGMLDKAINKAVALTHYCGDCNCDDCELSKNCYDTLDGIIFLQEAENQYLPVKKKPDK